MKLGVFLAIGESFSDFKNKGQDELIINYHLKNYSQNFEKVYVFSYANENIKYFSNVVILPNKWRLHRYIYSIFMPLLYWQTIKEIDVIRCFQISGGIPGIISKIFLKKKFVVNYGYDYVKFARIENKLFQSCLYKILIKFVLFFADKVIFTAKYLVGNLTTNYQLIPNGVDTVLFNRLKSKKDIDILYVGRLEKQKNLFSLIKSISLIKKYNLNTLFIGSGTLKNKLLKKAAKFKLKLKIIDSIPNIKLLEFYNRAKIFILPSYIEGQPKVLLEAMSCGVSVIASGIPAHKEIIVNKINGILCGTNADKIAKSIRYLYQNPKIRNKLSKNGRKTILLKYSKKSLNKQEINLLTNI